MTNDYAYRVDSRGAGGLGARDRHPATFHEMQALMLGLIGAVFCVGADICNVLERMELAREEQRR